METKTKTQMSDPEFVEKHKDSFEKAENLSGVIGTTCHEKYCYVFVMIESGVEKGAPLHLASNMSGSGLIELLMQVYESVTQDPAITPNGEGNA